jgi:hypothetical protein
MAGRGRKDIVAMSVPPVESTAKPEITRLNRVLTLLDLIIYGIVAITPSASATVYGLAEVESHGYVVVIRRRLRRPIRGHGLRFPPQ